jgi:hypothetical protein
MGLASLLLPAAGGPLVGPSRMMRGSRVNVNKSAKLTAEVPPAVVTVMFTVPVPAGATARIWLSLSTWKLVAAAVPNMTVVAPDSPEPKILTALPPSVEPELGAIDATLGACGIDVRVGVAVDAGVSVGVDVGMEVSVGVDVGVGGMTGSGAQSGCCSPKPVMFLDTLIFAEPSAFICQIRHCPL